MNAISRTIHRIRRFVRQSLCLHQNARDGAVGPGATIGTGRWLFFKDHEDQHPNEMLAHIICPDCDARRNHRVKLDPPTCPCGERGSYRDGLCGWCRDI